MFVACGIWCLADVSSVSPSSEQTGQSGVKYGAVKTWNETPNKIRASKSTKAFRKKYKEFLLSQ